MSITDRKVRFTDNGTLVYAADVVSYADYSPYGTLLDTRHGNDNTYRYGFQGQERDDEIKGAGNSWNYEYRMHDPRIGRFFACDPLEATYSYNSPYAFSENVVINAIELEGLEKYVVVGRSFAPKGSFSLTPFKDDDRTKFSSAGYKKAGVSARIHTKVVVDMDNKKVYKTIFSQKTEMPVTHQGVRLFSIDAYVEPYSQSITILSENFKNINNVYIKYAYEAVNGTSLGPPIDIQTAMRFKREGNDLTISTRLTGNTFPAQETVIFDEKGTGLFVAIRGADGHPYVDVWGSGTVYPELDYTSFKVATDDDGNFMGVYSKDANGNEVIMSPEAWNKQFENESAFISPISMRSVRIVAGLPPE